jgi:hypothetical protein
MKKTASQISDEVLEKLARARWKQELAPQYGSEIAIPMQGPQAGQPVRRGIVGGTPEQMKAYEQVQQYRQGRQTADPLRGGTQTLEPYMASQQLKNPGMTRGQAMPGPKPGQLPGGQGILSRLSSGFKKLPTWGKAGVGIGAALGAYGLGKHFFGGNDQPKQQYGAW